MTFDWFTLVAQLVNFGLLLLLLRLFLYRPILGVMEQREERMREAWAAANAAKAAAEEQARALKGERSELSRRRGELLAELEAEVKELRAERLEEAQREAERERERQRESLAAEQARVVGELQQRTSKIVLRELEALTREVAGEGANELAAARLMERLAHLPEDELGALKEAAVSAAPLVRSAAPLSSGARSAVAKSMQELLGTSAPPRFVTDPALLFGHEVAVGPLRFGSSASGRLAALEEAFASAVTAAHGSARGGERARRQ